jgi:hypothetical protein
MNQVLEIFKMSALARENNKKKVQEKYNNTIQRQTENVMSTETDRTQLHQSSKSIFKDPEVNSAREIMQKTNDINYILATLNELLPHKTPTRITDLKNSLNLELQEFRKNRTQKQNKKRYAFNPNAIDKCL